MIQFFPGRKGEQTSRSPVLVVAVCTLFFASSVAAIAQTAPSGSIPDANIPVVAAATPSPTATYLLNRDESVSYLQQGTIVLSGCPPLDSGTFAAGTGVSQNLVYDKTENRLYILSPLANNDPGIVYETPDPSGNCQPSAAIDLPGGSIYSQSMVTDSAENNLYVVDAHEGVNIDALYVLNTTSFASYSSSMPPPSYQLDYSGSYGPIAVDPSSHLVYVPELANGSVNTNGPGFWVFNPATNKMVRVLGYVNPATNQQVDIDCVQILIAGNGKIVLVNSNPSPATSLESEPLIELDTTQFSFFANTQAATGFPAGVYVEPPAAAVTVFKTLQSFSSISAADIDIADGLVFVAAYNENASFKIGQSGLLLSYNLAFPLSSESLLSSTVPQPTTFGATYAGWGQLTWDSYANEVLLFNPYYNAGAMAISTPLSSTTVQVNPIAAASFDPLGVVYNPGTGFIYAPSVATPSTPSDPAVFYFQPASATSPAAASLSLSGVPTTAEPGTGFGIEVVFTSAGTGTPTGTIAVTATPASGTPILASVAASTALAAGGNGLAVQLVLPNPGLYTLTAVYTGDKNFASASTSQLYSVIVEPFADSLALTAPAIATAGVNFPVTIDLTSSGAASPTGNITITATPNGGQSSTVATISAAAAFNAKTPASVTLPASGGYTLSASYAGDTNFAAASSQSAVTVSAATGPVPQGIAELVPGVISVFATTNAAGSVPGSVAFDGGGNLYVLDSGLGTVAEYPAGGGSAQSVLPASGGPVTLSQPSAIVYEPASQTLLISDTKNNRLVRLTPGAAVSATTLALTGIPAATVACANVIPDTALCMPTGLAEDAAGNIYVSDTNNDRVLKLTSGGTYLSVPLDSANPLLTSPLGLAVDSAGNIYVANQSGSGKSGAIFEVSFSGQITELDIPMLINPQGLAVDAAGNLYFSDLGSHSLGVVQNGGTVLAFAGSGAAADGSDSGPALLAGIASPLGLATDGAGNVYVADSSETAANGGLILKVNGTQSDVVFGSVAQGSTSSPMRVTLLNAGTGTVEIGGDVLSGANKADFALGNECELQLPPAGSCQLSVTFTPSAIAAETASLTLTAQIAGGNSSALTVQFLGNGAEQQAAAPTFNPPAGTYAGTQTVTIASNTPNAVIYYTTDGSTPTTSSSQYSASMQVTASETITAIATATGYASSTVATGAYTIGINTNGGFTLAGQVAAGATFTPSPAAWATTIGSSSNAALDTTKTSPQVLALLLTAQNGFNAPLTISSDFQSADHGTWYCTDSPTGADSVPCTVTPTAAGTVFYIAFLEGMPPAANTNADQKHHTLAHKAGKPKAVQGASLGLIASVTGLLLFGLVWRKRGIFQAGVMMCLAAVVVSASVLLSGCNPAISSATVTAFPAGSKGANAQSITVFINSDTTN